MTNGTTEKVDLIWKVLILGGLAFAGKVSMNAWDRSQATLDKLVEVTGSHETRITVLERLGDG